MQAIRICPRLRDSTLAVLCPLFMAAWLQAVPAVEPAVTAKLAPDVRLTVGDVFLLTVSAVYPEGWTVRFPSAGEKLGEFQVREQKLSPSAIEGSARRQDWMVSLACYRPGHFEVPAIRVAFIDTEGKASEKSTAPVPVEIQSVIKEQNPELRELKPQMDLPEDYSRVWIGLLCVLSAAAAALLLRRYISRRRKAGLPAKPATPEIPPHEEALRALEELAARNLPARGLLRQFYFELSEIIRRMVGRQYRVVTLERTTVEILGTLQGVPHEPLQLKKLEDFLERCDLIKFAKHEPLPVEQDDLWHGARAFIEDVKASFESALRADPMATDSTKERGGQSL